MPVLRGTRDEYVAYVEGVLRRWRQAGYPSSVVAVPSYGDWSRGAEAPEPPAPPEPVIQVGVVQRGA